MNIKIGILNVPKHCNKHNLIRFVTSALPRNRQITKHLALPKRLVLYDMIVNKMLVPDSVTFIKIPKYY